MFQLEMVRQKFFTRKKVPSTFSQVLLTPRYFDLESNLPFLINIFGIKVLYKTSDLIVFKFVLGDYMRSFEEKRSIII